MGIVARFKKLLDIIREQGEYNAPVEYHWISASENPFGIDILDISSYTERVVSLTGDATVATTFNKFRSTQGREYIGQEPEECCSANCRLEYPPIQALQDGCVFKAATMEDKRDIYLFDFRLYFCRSWTGALAYRANVHSETDKLRVSQIDYAKPLEDDPLDAVRDVDYLIKSHIYDAVVPHPFPKKAPNNPKQLAIYSFSNFGRRCRYGSYDDTIKIKIGIGLESRNSNKRMT